MTDKPKNRRGIKLPVVGGGGVVDNKTKVSELVSGMKTVGFQATQLSKAVDLIRRMKRDKATIILTFTSNMVSSGLREVFADLVKRKYVDAIITGVGSIEEDVMKTLGDFFIGDFELDDAELRRKGINRIGNVLVPNDRYVELEKWVQPFLAEIYERQKKEGKLVSPRELITEMGKQIKDEKSILYWASRNQIPIFCPAITDGAFGLQVYFFKQKHPDFGIDTTGDMREMANLVLNADKTGGILLGGGFAKHHALGVNILREGFDYAVYVSTSTEYDGSLSGARPREAVSWNKLKEKEHSVYVEGDATIIFPLMLGALLE